MRPDPKSTTAPMHRIQPKGNATLSRRASWRRWVVVLGVLSVLGASRSYSADQVSSAPTPSATPPFAFSEFTKNKPFRLNTLPTTPYGPAWADILLKPENFLECRGAPIALCYYSGPGPVTTCDLTPGQTLANCSCYEIPSGPPYFVDINAILNLDVYLATVIACGNDGSGCLPRGSRTAPVCDAINKNTLIPGADLISTFSHFLDQVMPISQTTCANPALYAGCMTAPCKRTGDIDPTTGLPIVQCACPTFTGPYQVGQALNQTGQQCVLEDNLVWSAAFAPLEGGTIFPTTPTCFPDVPGGCPLLSPNPPQIPPPPSNVSCAKVCAEYKRSNQKGVEIGFTCDATLCTATPADFDLVQEACSGLENSSVSEILKLETEVGFSCAASQICGCQPDKKTNASIFDLNERQRARSISPQCDLNGTLCGAPRGTP